MANQNYHLVVSTLRKMQGIAPLVGLEPERLGLGPT